MKLFVVDASIAVKWYIPEEHSEIARLLLDDNFRESCRGFSFLSSETFFGRSSPARKSTART